VLEERFLILCESSGMTPSEVNVTLAGLEVDALWRGQRVIVELDGHEAHSYPAAAERDRRRDLMLRGAGYEIRRYTWEQITEHPEQVIGDLSAALSSNTEAI
jgi:very-short-patch-repair endonuclease